MAKTNIKEKNETEIQNYVAQKEREAQLLIAKEVADTIIKDVEPKLSFTAAELEEIKRKAIEDAQKERELELLTSKLNDYKAAAKGNLTDKEFILRLFKLNVPRPFLAEFSDLDKGLSDKDIWHRVRHSTLGDSDEYQNPLRTQFKLK